MSRKLTSILVSGALVLSMTTSAWAQTVSSPPLPNQQVQSIATSEPLTTGTQVATATAAKNQPPLAPGGAAGIEVAQGGSPVLWWVVGALVAGALLWWIFSDDDDSGTDTSPSDS